MIVERTNPDLDLIDNAVDELHLLLQNKPEGVGVIRVEDGALITEYHASLENAKSYPGEQNLVMTMAKDNVDRKTIRDVCYARYSVMRNENQ